MTTVTLHVTRSSPAEGLAPQSVRFEIPVIGTMTVLDAVAHAQRHAAPDLAYRYACRVGMCGSCAMVVNGRERWACRTLLAKLGTREVTVEPLRNLPVVKDLVVDMTPMTVAMGRTLAYFVPSRAEAATGVPRPDGRDWSNIAETLGRRPSIDPHVECITCGACYSACTMVSWDPDYLGPAALNRAATLIKDPRDDADAPRLGRVDGEHGCWRCHSQFTCTDVCPMQLRPSESIGYLKRRILAEAIQGGLGVDLPADAPPPRRAVLRHAVTLAAALSLLIGAAYWVGVQAAVDRVDADLLVGPTVTSQVLAGALMFEERCESCHSVLGQGGRDRARDLWRAGERYDRAQLRELLRDPYAALGTANMPAYDTMPERDLAALVEYLAGLDFARRRPGRVARREVRGGGEIHRRDCLRCHDGTAGAQGPAFNGLGERRERDWLAAYLEDPAFHRDLVPDAATLTGARRAAIAAYLAAR